MSLAGKKDISDMKRRVRGGSKSPTPDSPAALVAFSSGY
jgi:hypothetical protein